MKQAILRIASRLRDRRAAVAIIVALSAPVLVGFSALAVDVTYWYGTHEALQTAADAGALAAARFGTTNQAALQTVAANAANAATGNQFKFTPGSSSFVVAPSTSPNGVNVAVTASAPGGKFLSSVIYSGTPILQASAVAALQGNYTPPASATCFSSSSYTYVVPNGNGVGFTHVAGIDPVNCGNTSLIQPLTYLAQGQSGTVQDLPIRLNDNGGTLPSQGLANNTPNYVPGCSAAYNPNNPTTNASQPSSVVVNGVQTFFGPATLVQPTGGGWGGGWGGNGGSYQPPAIYGFAPIVIGPGNSFCNASNLCTIPAGAYCGGLQINPGVTLDFVANQGTDQFQILDGNLLMSTSDPFGPSNDPSASFFFGGSQIGSLILDTQTTIYSGGLRNGNLVFTSSMTSRSTDGRGTTIVDQLCPLGVLPIGVASSGAPICPTEVTSASNGITTTTLDTSNTVTGPTTPSYTIPTNGVFSATDTYTTTVNFVNGHATSWQQGETTTNTNLDLPSYGGNLGKNASSARTTAPFASCAGSSSVLFNASSVGSSPNLGLSYASGGGAVGTIALNDAVSVCGKGMPLIANPSGSELVASSASATSTVLLTK